MEKEKINYVCISFYKFRSYKYIITLILYYVCFVSQLNIKFHDFRWGYLVQVDKKLVIDMSSTGVPIDNYGGWPLISMLQDRVALVHAYSRDKLFRPK
jgi:hypothetical protein